MTTHHSHCNSFAGISGCVTGDGKSAAHDSHPNLLVDPSGRWAIRLTAIDPAMGRTLLQILRDLSPASAAHPESVCLHQVAALDVAARADMALLGEIERGLAALDVQARKLTRTIYTDVTEAALRRNLLIQLNTDPLMERLGVRTHAYSAAAV